MSAVTRELLITDWGAGGLPGHFEALPTNPFCRCQEVKDLSGLPPLLGL
jgi:hypothetical protein